jgi:hypothetical protein
MVPFSHASRVAESPDGMASWAADSWCHDNHLIAQFRVVVSPDRKRIAMSHAGSSLCRGIVEVIAATRNGGIISAMEIVTGRDLRGIVECSQSENLAHLRSASIAGLNVSPFCNHFFFLDYVSAHGKRSTKWHVLIDDTLKALRMGAASRNTIIHSMPDSMGKVMGKETCNVLTILTSRSAAASAKY